MPTVYVTAPADEAPDLARHLVETGLAAAVNRLPCSSVYRWDGAVVEDDEAILLIQTTDEAYDALVDRIVDRHSYDVPCIERFEETDVLPAFADWRADAVRDGED
jgi:periplasmic divalent cation tolerance protein